MKKAFLFICLATVLFVACKSDQSQTKREQISAASTQASPFVLAGQWIAMDFCARANQYGSVLGAMNNAHVPYAYAFEFLPDLADSVICYDGNRSWKLAVKYKRDTLEFQNAFEGKSIFAIYHSQGEKDMTVFDGTKGRTRMDRYIKSSANTADAFGAFMVALHHNLFQGLMLPIGKGTSRDSLLFTPGGSILKWKEYDTYRVCVTADCLTAKEPYDVIILAKSDKPNSERRFAFRYNATNDTLTLYHLIPNRADEKAAHDIGGVAYRFRRIQPQQR
ncbi:MAG: hypothetical protein NZM43_11325 [Saprospiraceae bacterium]|nr:hypothetical protein [Saprospiraceae bacterium]MDW8484899.1 hypothetical protein [Saprospiraceae bacterium]